jgi:hypothetical protein
MTEPLPLWYKSVSAPPAATVTSALVPLTEVLYLLRAVKVRFSAAESKKNFYSCTKLSSVAEMYTGSVVKN